MLDKEKVTELVMQSGLHEYGFGHDRERFMTALAYFATALQHEVLTLARGDAEPVAWMYYFLNSENRDEVIRNWVTQDPADIQREKGFNVRPLFAHPTPAVVRQLVEALEELLAESEQGYAICPLTIKQARAALAAAKDAK